MNVCAILVLRLRRNSVSRRKQVGLADPVIVWVHVGLADPIIVWVHVWAGRPHYSLGTRTGWQTPFNSLGLCWAGIPRYNSLGRMSRS